ncbi:hypothetical protein POVWA2_027980 [Plasmodium ovale wallikeri]|uniref:Uncharacterized protein n=1 Tax=Plasmodium ovale wallikeri TaxID=864142 RepID=A0A1A8YWX4_PLAOA|nr:hypothetical protein POVWA1_028110 [Plasmodium ovale wallikeri]SBT36042.1 hypothetical protein POVWA2_027980 [Plasmodium ovale wallikeri]
MIRRKWRAMTYGVEGSVANEHTYVRTYSRIYSCTHGENVSTNTEFADRINFLTTLLAIYPTFGRIHLRNGINELMLSNGWLVNGILTSATDMCAVCAGACQHKEGLLYARTNNHKHKHKPNHNRNRSRNRSHKH